MDCILVLLTKCNDVFAYSLQGFDIVGWAA